HSGRTEWAAIVLFYQQLIRILPTLGTRTGYAAALAEEKGPSAGLAALDGIELASVSNYQPYWAVRAHLLQRLEKLAAALEAFDRAIGLAEDPAVRQFLLEHRGSSFLAGSVEIGLSRTSPSGRQLVAKLATGGERCVHSV